MNRDRLKEQLMEAADRVDRSVEWDHLDGDLEDAADEAIDAAEGDDVGEAG